MPTCCICDNPVGPSDVLGLGGTMHYVCDDCATSHSKRELTWHPKVLGPKHVKGVNARAKRHGAPFTGSNSIILPSGRTAFIILTSVPYAGVVGGVARLDHPQVGTLYAAWGSTDATDEPIAGAINPPLESGDKETLDAWVRWHESNSMQE